MTAASSTPHRVVVIGHGMVGHRFVAELARGAEQSARSGRPIDVEVSVLGAEPYEPYNRLMLSEVLAGRADLGGLTLPAAPAGMRVFAGRPAVELNRESRVVVDDLGSEHPYDTVVLATGAAPRVPRLAGLPADSDPDDLPPGVRALRTVDDCRELLALASGRGREGGAPRVVVLGGGLLGLEAARALVGRGARVAVVHSGAHVLDRQLDADAGSVLLRSLRDLGVHVVRSARAAGLRRDDDGRLVGLDLADGRHLRCDAVLLTAGVAPRVRLAVDAGLPCERGVLVGDDLRSFADPAVAAIGDCAQTPAGCPGLLAPGWDQAAALAARLVGDLAGGSAEAASVAASVAEEEPAAPEEVVRLKAADLDVVTFGRLPRAADPAVAGECVDDLAGWDATDSECRCASEPAGPRVLALVDGQGRRSLRIAVHRGRLVGGELVGAGSLGADLVVAYERDLPLPLDPANLLVNGSASLPTAASPANIPGSATICRCNGVSKSAIVDAFQAGERTMPQLSATTRAATGCGSCKDACTGILEWLEKSDPQQRDEAGGGTGGAGGADGSESTTSTRSGAGTGSALLTQERSTDS
ncbi:FAD-dependent oxidoreductase [Piscicoccus intestinalis]|uniref:FAD-dependent oxidoreductase n=1 Tax=Piscicoccus intestinalis TaxID=746033 RepID=UPI0008380B4E|nr:FAD-dependent oxidoreductase [Piscicoccus intestinalis]